MPSYYNEEDLIYACQYVLNKRALPEPATISLTNDVSNEFETSIIESPQPTISAENSSKTGKNQCAQMAYSAVP